MNELVAISADLASDLNSITFAPPVAHVYNPLVYAWEPHECFLRRYGVSGSRDAVFVGMNPGPWGMAQTGVPFGEISVVRDWLEVDGRVECPPREHPRKRVTGFSCHRSEVSGKRLWGLIMERFPCPDDFFARFFVVNYCPLLFLDSCGRNITPDKLRAEERGALRAACDRALRRSVEVLCPRHVVGIGNYAADQALVALEGMDMPIGRILHPSPSNPTANRGWKEIVLKQLHEQGIPF